MQSVSRQVEIARLAGGIKVCQGESDAVQLVGGYPGGVVSLIEPPQTSMAKRTDHGTIIPCTDTAINGSAKLSHTDARWLPIGALTKWLRSKRGPIRTMGSRCPQPCATRRFDGFGDQSGRPNTRVRTGGAELSLRIADHQAKVRIWLCIPLRSGAVGTVLRTFRYVVAI